jgi:hypothetical protein
MAIECDTLVLSMCQEEARSFAFTLATTTGALDLTNYDSVVVHIKNAPYIQLPDLITKTLTTTSDSNTIGQITDPTAGVFVIRITADDIVNIDPGDYALIIDLVSGSTVQNISYNNNTPGIFRITKA